MDVSKMLQLKNVTKEFKTNKKLTKKINPNS